MLIRKLTQKDQGQLGILTSPQPAYTIFLMGNCETLGWENPNLQYWGAFDNQELKAVLMRYRTNWAAWWNQEPSEQTLQEFGRIFTSFKDNTHFTGHPRLLDKLLTPGYRVVKAYQQRLAQLEEIIWPNETCSIRRAVPQDLEALYELYKEEMPRKKEALADDLTRDKYYVGVADGRVVTALSVSARSSKAAMIGGVCTPPEYRKKGYASWLVAQVSQRLQQEGRIPTLFYHNPAAGSIYRKLGFRELGPFSTLVLQRKE